jgi:hypothetical protein
MGKIIKIFLLLTLCNSLSYSQIGWDLDYQSANFAFLMVGYDSNNFEGGYFKKIPYRKGYDNEYIPFTVIYNSPIDYGNITFLYSATMDTIFAADIWWAGQGHITFPDAIDSASQFNYDSTIIGKPISTSYLNYVDEIADSIFDRKADSAWASVKKLSILKKFDTLGTTFRVGLYLFAPAVGKFRSEVAKWILFLYRGQIVTGIDKERQLPNNSQLLQNYPNPFNPTTTIEFSIPKTTYVSLKIYDVLGREIATLASERMNAGTYMKTWNASNIPSGVYFYRLNAGQFVETKKLMLLK